MGDHGIYAYHCIQPFMAFKAARSRLLCPMLSPRSSMSFSVRISRSEICRMDCSFSLLHTASGMLSNSSNSSKAGG